jgi:hypothetical protein
MGKKKSARYVRNDGGVLGPDGGGLSRTVSSELRGACGRPVPAVVSLCRRVTAVVSLREGVDEKSVSRKNESLVPVRWNKRFCYVDFVVQFQHD